MRKLAFLLAAAVVALFGVMALGEAAALRHYGKWTLVSCAILLFTHAAGLLTRRPVSWIFGMAFLAIVAAGLVGGGTWVIYQGITQGSPGGWAGLATLIVMVYSAVGIAAGVIVGLILIALGAGRETLGGEPSGVRWGAAALGALLSLAELGWLVGHEFYYREMRNQNACAGGNVLQCAELARRKAKFNRDERLGFALRGCELDHLNSCQELAGLIGGEHVAGSREVSAIAAQCSKGMLSLCRKLGVHLLASGDATNGAEHLTFACGTNPSFCSGTAKDAVDHGEATLARGLLDAGCAARDPRSCRALLKEHGSTFTVEERKRLELRVCMVGIHTDCTSPMRRDFHGTCESVCETRGAERPHSCMVCAREAARRGEAEFARKWMEASCANGAPLACKELKKPDAKPGRGR